MPRMLASIAGLVVLVTYVLLAGPTFYWLDSSELVAASWELGVAHPPGHPLATLLGRLFCYLPVGTIAFRVTLASATAAAAATALVLLCTLELLRGREGGAAGPRGLAVSHGVGALIAALTVGFSYPVAFQAVRAEVYALNLALVVGAFYALLRWDRTRDRRWLLVAGLVTGLGLCNHHLLVLLAGPAMALFVLARRRPASGLRRVVVGLVLCGALGLSTLAYLPLRAAQAPRVNWGSPTTVERFGWVVSARLFQRTVDRVSRTEPLGERVAAAAFGLFGGLGPAGAMLGLGGLYLLWRRRQSWRQAALLTFGVLGNLASPLLVGFDPFNPDAHGYIAVATALLAPALGYFVAVLVAAVARAAPRVVVAAVVAVASLVVVYQAVVQLPRADLRGHWAAEESARVLADLPPGSVLLTSYYKTIFNLWALRSTADLRPDVALLHRNFVSLPGYLETLSARRHPLTGLARAWRDGGAPPLDRLDRLSLQRAVLVQFDANVPARLAARLHPAGPLLRYGRPGPPGEHRARLAAWRAALGPRPWERETLRSAIWTHYLLARFACQRDLGALAAEQLGAGLSLAPHDRKLRKLRAACPPLARPQPPAPR